MKKSVLCAVLVLALTACSEKKFQIEGQITNAKDSVLYFENMGLAGVEVLDSVRLDDEGSFSFSGEKQDAPEFYRLRIHDQIISLAIDSTETVTVRGQWPQMAREYEVSGSKECETIRELALKQMDLQQRAIKVNQDEALSVDQVNDSILKMVQRYKDEVKRQYIFPNPGRPSAYFALFQTLGGMLLFNPQTDKDDVKVFAAVATSWDTFWPTAERGKNLHNIAIEGMKTQRILQAKQQSASIDMSKVVVSEIIDVPLVDNHGNRRSLTELKGKVVLLDFHAFSAPGSTQRIMQLREVYNKYHAQGLEIYQVSVDPDEHFWKTQTAALPWINVHDPNNLQSEYLARYNVQNIPTFFLITRGNALHKRDAQIKNLDAEIKSLLAK